MASKPPATTTASNGISFEQPSSGIIVDREKQARSNGPAQYKRCRFADDQAHIIQSSAPPNNDNQRTRSSSKSRHRHRSAIETGTTGQISSAPGTMSRSFSTVQEQQLYQQLQLQQQQLELQQRQLQQQQQLLQQQQLQQQHHHQQPPPQQQYQQPFLDENGDSMYYPNDYQTHSAPGSFIRRGGRGQGPMPDYNQMDYQAENQMRRSLSSNGQLIPYQQQHQQLSDQQVFYDQSGLEQYNPTFVPANNPVFVPANNPAFVQANPGFDPRRPGSFRRTLPGTQGLDQRQPIPNHRTLNGSPSFNRRQSSLNPGLDQRQPVLYHRTLTGSIASRRHNHLTGNACKFIPPEIYQKAVQLKRCHPHQLQSRTVSEAMKPFFSEFEILENTLPENDMVTSSAGWNQAMEQKFVTTLQYTHFHPPLQLQQQQFKQQLQQPPLSSMVHIPQEIFKSRSRVWLEPERDFLLFRAPLKIEHVENILERAITGDGAGELLRIHHAPVLRPTGGTLYLQRDAIASLYTCQDGYNWTEVLHQEGLSTPRGYILDYRHFYISSPRGWRMSSRFRKETYTIGDLSLVALIGDERESRALGNDEEEIPSLNFNSNSWPRSRKSSDPRTSLDRRNDDLAILDRWLDDEESRIDLMDLNKRCSRSLERARFNNVRQLEKRCSRSLERSRYNNKGFEKRLSRSLERTRFDLRGFDRRQSRSLERTRFDYRAIERRTSRSLERTRFGYTDSSLLRRSERPRSLTRLTRSADPDLLALEAHNPDPDPKNASQEWFNELMSVARELSGGKLLKNMTMYPTMQITLVHPEMTREFEHACQVLTSENVDRDGDIGIRLFYDMTFPIGRFNATLLTFSNACYEGSPVLPLAINLHESRFKSCHQLFWARIVGDIPALQKHRFPLFIDDGEPAVHLAVRMQAPNLVQLEGWVHRFRDISTNLRAKGYGKEAINYFKACVTYLLTAKSKQAMHEKFRTEFECIWPRDFVQYYREKLLPRSGRLGQWALSKVNVHELHFQNPNANPQESFYQTSRHFGGWQHLTLAQLIRAFDLLFNYYVFELHKGNSIRRLDGAFSIKDVFRPFFYETSNAAIFPSKNVYHPSKICNYVQEHFPPRKYEEERENSIVPLTNVPAFEDDFVLPVRSDEIGANDQEDEVEDELDIEKVLEKVFAENEKNKLEMKNKFQKELENFENKSHHLFLEQNFSQLSINHFSLSNLVPEMPKSLQTSAQAENEANSLQLEQSSPPKALEMSEEVLVPQNVQESVNRSREAEMESYDPLQTKSDKRKEENGTIEEIARNLDDDDKDQFDNDEMSIVAFSSRAVSDFSDSGNEDLVIYNSDETQTPVVPTRPHTLLLTTRISNSEALYNYNQNAQAEEDQKAMGTDSNVCYNQADELEDLIDTFSQQANPVNPTNPANRLDETSNNVATSFQSFTVQSNLKETLITNNDSRTSSFTNQESVDETCLVTDSGVALTVTQTTTTTTSAATVLPAVGNIGRRGTLTRQATTSQNSSGFVSWSTGSAAATAAAGATAETAAGNLLVTKSNGLMLWRKVQNCVVVCGGIVNASSGLATDNLRLPGIQQQQQQEQQHHQQQEQQRSIEYNDSLATTLQN